MSEAVRGRSGRDIREKSGKADLGRTNGRGQAGRVAEIQQEEAGV
jgi:hypothetical protein